MPDDQPSPPADATGSTPTPAPASGTPPVGAMRPAAPPRAPSVPTPYPVAAPPPPPPGAFPPPPPAYPGAPPAPYPGAFPGGVAGAPVRSSTNGFAVAALVLGIVGIAACGIPGILALIFGYVARRQIDESRGVQTGRGMATAGIVLGWIWVSLLVLYVGVLVVASFAGA